MRTQYIALILLCGLFAGCSSSAQVSTTEVIAMPSKTITLDPADSIWDDAPLHISKLVLQDMVEPRLMEASTAEVQVKAITSGPEIAFRVEWADATTDDQTRPGQFIDGCAVQVPSKIEASLPAPQMGEANKAVEITFWRADWQAFVDGREDSIRSAYPNASVDHYPYQAPSLEKGSPDQQEMEKRYSPAAAANNRRAGPRETAVEDLIAQGPGTLSPAPQSVSKGRGIRTSRGWAVVIVRPLPEGFDPQNRSQIAFAVWEGSHKEVGARKMRTGWVPLVMKGQP